MDLEGMNKEGGVNIILLTKAPLGDFWRNR
jgi:hypothetical protein